MHLRIPCLAALRRAIVRVVLSLPFGLPLARAESPDCPPPPVPPTLAEQQAARDRGFLWTLRKDGTTSWLYGTVHALRAEWAVPGPRVREALDGAATVAFELDPADPSVQRRLVEALAARPDRTLPAPLRARLERALRGECVDADALAGFAPEMQAVTLLVNAIRRDGLESAFGSEMVLARLARATGKPVMSLETPQEQARALLMADPADTEAMVASALDDLDSGRARALTARLVRAWAESDHATLEAYASWCECRRTRAEAAALDRLLDERNPALAERIAALHRPGRPVFAAVGSLHMTGPNGLPALLARRGFTVEPVALRPRSAPEDR